MKRKSLILVLVALFCLFFTGLTRVSAAEEKTFEKITDVSQITSGASYLIVYETDNLCFDGSLSSLDAVSNYKSVTIENSRITVDSSYAFTLILSGDVYNVKASSGNCIGRESDSNGLLCTAGKTYANTISFENGNVNIVSSGAYLRYNATSGQTRFRYYSSGTYTNQKAIQLYKEVVAGGETPEQPDTPVVPEPTNEVEKVNKLFTEYYNEGTYVKNTSIYLNATAVEELATHFHVENHLVRTTYYTPEALWMSQGAEGEGVKYSYYGSAANNGGVTYGVAENALEAPETTNVVLSGAGKESMEAYYTTLADLKSNTAVWVADGNGYATTDATVLAWFLDFTAPCLYGSVITSNYFSYAKATVEEENDELVLKLWVTSENWSAIANGVEGSDNVLSTAVISYEKEFEVSIEKAIEIAKAAGSTYTSDKYTVTGTITEVYNTTYGNMHIQDENGNDLTIYGTYSEDGSTRYDAMSYKPIVGDVVTLYGILGTYNSTAQMKDSWLLDVVAHECELSEPTCSNRAKCSICGVEQGELSDHVDEDKNHECDECGTMVGVHEANDEGNCDYCGEAVEGDAPVIGILAEFTFGANGSASHVDPNSKFSNGKSYTSSGYTLKFTTATNVYDGGYDAKGNSCIKLGTSSKIGSFDVTVPENVTKVIIYVAQYKSNTTKITVNGTSYTITTASNNGAYTAIEVDTTTNKTVNFATVSGGVRCMIDKIVFEGYAK